MSPESGCTVQADARRVITSIDNNDGEGWTALSSAVLNGGHLQVSPSPSTTSHRSTSSNTSSRCMHVLNAKVPANYDGVHPDPEALLKRFVKEENLDPNTTIGLLTAASMQTLRTASRRANGVVVDAIVTAGISNARRVGADADCFLFGDEEYDNGNKDCSNDFSLPPPPGTINTVVVTNATLTQGALVEAYMIAVEAKCAACSDLGLICSSSMLVAQGTGTDCTVIITPNSNDDDNNNKDDTGAAGHSKRRRTVKHAGKHTLFAELLGQVVYKATKEAVLTNIYHVYGDRVRYAVHCWIRQVIHLLRGARPCIPPRPMMPVPSAPLSVVLMGISAVLLAFVAPFRHATRVLIAALAWDRYLGEPPLSFHPVVITGKLISTTLRHTPNAVYESPALGLLCGLLLLSFMMALSMAATGYILVSIQALTDRTMDSLALNRPFGQDLFRLLCAFTIFMLEAVLVKSTFSLQLLCTIALQMAKFLERQQLDEARDQLSWLCSRDPSKLGSQELAGATLESLAENFSDGFVAPMFWYTVWGPLGALGYRVVNTLDSRIGYRGGQFEWFGKPSALLDDLMNLIPSRLTALLMMMVALFIPGCNAVMGLRVAWNDSSQCDSPNAGWPMGAMAGLLGVRLEKKDQYSLGVSEGFVSPGSGSIRIGHRVAQLAGGLAAVVAFALCNYLHGLRKF